MSEGLCSEEAVALIQKVEWVVQATLTDLAKLKDFTPQNPNQLRVVVARFEGRYHNLFLFQNSVFFNLPKTASGSFKTAIPMVDLRTGALLMRLRVKETRAFESFKREQELQILLAHPNILPILGAVAYEAKGYLLKPSSATSSSATSLAAKARSLQVDERYRHSILTPAYSYSLHYLCVMHAFSEFTKLHIALKIAGAVEHIHRNGHLHNDLKASNISLNDAMEVVVSDYGLSTPLSSLKREEYLASVAAELKKGPLARDKREPNLTTSFIASPELPETYYTMESDIFAFGAVLHEICGKGSLFPMREYNEDNFYHSKLTKETYNRQLDETLGARCSFDCLENLARDALSFHPKDRPSMTAILERLNALRSHFHEDQVPFLPKFKGVSPLAKLSYFHTRRWKRCFQPSTEHFSTCKYSFSLWIDQVLRESSLPETAKREYLIRAKQIFEVLTPTKKRFHQLLAQSSSLDPHAFFFKSISNDAGEILGRLLVAKEHLLYPSLPIFEDLEVKIQATYNIKTGWKTHVAILTAKTSEAVNKIKLCTSLPSKIRNHPSLMHFQRVDEAIEAPPLALPTASPELPTAPLALPTTSVALPAPSLALPTASPDLPTASLALPLSVAASASSLSSPIRSLAVASEEAAGSRIIRESVAPRVEQTTWLYRLTRCYSEALSSRELLTPLNLGKWATNFAHLLTLLHEEGLLLGRLQLHELGIDNTNLLVIEQLNGLIRKSELLEWCSDHAGHSPLPKPYLSLFGDLISEKNDVRNLAMLLFVFTEQLLHPKPLTGERNHKTLSSLLAISDQAALDSYLDATLSPRADDRDDLPTILRDMLCINPEARLSSQAAHKRLLALGDSTKCAIM